MCGGREGTEGGDVRTGRTAGLKGNIERLPTNNVDKPFFYHQHARGVATVCQSETRGQTREQMREGRKARRAPPFQHQHDRDTYLRTAATGGTAQQMRRGARHGAVYQSVVPAWAEIGSGSSKREQKIRACPGEADAPAPRLVGRRLDALQMYEACVHAYVVVVCG